MKTEKWMSMASPGALFVTWCQVGEKPSKASIKSPVIAACQFCSKWAVVALPEGLKAVQPDDTTHVCHPILGGCNQGYAMGAT